MLKLAQLMLSWRKCRRKLQKKHAKFPVGTQNRHRAQKDAEHRFFQSRRELYFTFSVGPRALLQIRRQQFRRCRMKRKELVQFHIESKPIRRGGTPTLNHSQIRHRIKRRIHLHHLKVLCVPTEPLMREYPFRIPTLNETRIGPARSSDKNFAAFRLHRAFLRHSKQEPRVVEKAINSRLDAGTGELVAGAGFEPATAPQGKCASIGKIGHRLAHLVGFSLGLLELFGTFSENESSPRRASDKY